jgi:hypothetical protein
MVAGNDSAAGAAPALGAVRLDDVGVMASVWDGAGTLSTSPQTAQ